MSTGDEIKDKLYKLSVAPFVLERQGEYQKAINIHKSAIDVLGAAAQTFRKSGSIVRKIHRKMFERQVQLHRERLAHLEDLQRKGDFSSIVLPPSGLDVVQELAREDEDSPWTLSQIRKALHDYHKDESTGKMVPDHLKPFLDAADSTQIPFFAPTLSPSAEIVTYRLTHSSELVELGVRSHWWFVKDPTNTHVLYALQVVWSQQVPIVEAILRRAGEFLPEMGALNIRIRKTKGGSFRLVTSTVPPDGGQIVEIPDGELQRKDWSPRRFQYGGRNFVWKSGRADGKSMDGGLFRSFTWETLYETKRVWPKDGSRTGKMEDETVGPKLCWGEKGGNGATHSIYMVGGLDLQFREHLLAAQLARLTRCSYPPQKDLAGVEAVSTGSSILGLIDLVS
ncbi:hypothetical protein ASPVEDRAFT_149244 [Aspergillus versicolor CBS 583.65]|uniref:Uncharacterized protein n=1 Tax=Aspergillus versicolor CBS 583.65 TaxID=1036611 RepID=A0A1L9PFG7_ASPVE|nr:uncharacterized protein ASPVEDRAFT_149244 [Aspergillus versicolor CBS 583.65]OJJ00281.1 hypothetical protein ASPVEDRAFT_149244 [Aspergillus versicolor CBS 583.65]